MSIALLERAASALDDLLEEVSSSEGRPSAFWITDPAAPEPRSMKDVDVIVEVTSRGRFAEFEERLRAHGFREDQESGITCRWRHGDDLILDAMPTDASILGYENRWQAAAVPFAVSCELPSGRSIAAVPPPFLLATKLEAFASVALRTTSEAATWQTSSACSTDGPSSSTSSQAARRSCAPTWSANSPASVPIPASSTASTAGCSPTRRARIARS